MFCTRLKQAVVRGRHGIAFFLLFVAGSLYAEPLLEFTDQAQADRYQRLIFELRCPMCSSTNLAGSDAPVATDLRAQVYLMLQQGHSDAEILEFMRARYGDFILYRPRLTFETFFLWFGPVLMLVFGALLLWYRLVLTRPTETTPVLTEDEQKRLDALSGEPPL